MIYVNRNLKNGGTISNETYVSDFGITADNLINNNDKVFCHINNAGDVFVETLCPDSNKIETEIRLFTSACFGFLITNLKRTKIWKQQLKNLLTVLTKSQIPPRAIYPDIKRGA